MDTRERSASADVALAASDAFRRRGQLAVLIGAMLLWTTLPTVVTLVTAGRSSGLEDSTSSVLITGFAARLETPLQLLLIGTCALVLLANLRVALRAGVGRPLAVLLAFATLVLTSTATSGKLSLTALIVLLIGMAVWSIQLRPGDLVVLGRFAAALGCTSLAMAVCTPFAWQADEEKGLLGDAVLAGPFAQMNVLGMCLTALLPFVGYVRSRPLRWLTLLSILAALVLAASRTSLLAAAVVCACACVLALARTAATRRTVFVLLLLAIVAGIVALPLATDDPRAFTQRGRIWMTVLELSDDHFWFGAGSEVFRLHGMVYEAMGRAAAHGHNLFAHYLMVGGVLGLAAMGSLLLLAAISAWRFAGVTRGPMFAVLALLALGIAETPLRVETFDGPAWATWSALFAVSFLVPAVVPMERADRPVATTIDTSP